MEDERVVRVQIDEQRQSSDNYGPSTTFEPQRESQYQVEERESTNNADTIKRSIARAPEKKLTLFALRLAILEKMASGLGTLGFIWATVVLLGGFAITLEKTDFWFITTILLIEGARIFSRSHELEWQHQATWSFTDAGRYSFRALKSSSHLLVRGFKAILKPVMTIGPKNHHDRQVTKTTHRGEFVDKNVKKFLSRNRTWETSDVPLLPYAKWVFLSKNISKLLYWLQLLSASACVSLSLVRLIQQDFGEISKGDSDKRNRKSALNIFYSLALAEAMLFLLEKAYWEWKVIYYKLLEEVNRDCDFGPSGLVSVRRFFYDSYSKCVNGSIFDGLKMDLVSFAIELLGSDSFDEQLTGARILRKFAKNERFSGDTLQKIGISIYVMERLVEMLNWKDPEEEEIRKSAAEILSILAGKKQNSLRVAGIPGAMESISSLLHTRQSPTGLPGEIFQKNILLDQANYEFSAFNNLGLHILKKLARDHDNCGKIGNTRGLLPKIVDFTHTGERFLRGGRVTESQIITVKRSLQLMKMLSSTTGSTGKLLRREISEIVFTISNIRDILRYGENYPLLQKLGIEILTSLALEEDATERIGSTGGLLNELFKIFLKQDLQENRVSVGVAAGEALAMLVFDSEENCRRTLKLGVVEKLVEALKDRLLCVNSGRILRNLCSYSSSDCYFKLREITSAAPYVLEKIMSEENKLQEVMLGLASQIFKFMTPIETRIMFEQTEVRQIELAKKLVQILKNNKYPPIKVPRIRRYTIEVVIWMMREEDKSIEIFRQLGLEKELENVTETTSELESYNVFSGTIGLSRHKKTIHSLVEIALQLLGDV